MFIMFVRVSAGGRIMEGTGANLSYVETRKPNIYKGMLGLMDLGYKEFADIVELRFPGVANASEICRAVRGKDSPKYELIRRLIIEEFLLWIGSVK